jgi:fatty-acyl-CoA synthase
MAVASYDILSFDGFLTHWAAERQEWVALSQEDRHFTYGQLEERTAKIVAMLLGLGLKKGDRIAWIGKNSDLYFALFYGAARIGVVMVPV